MLRVVRVVCFILMSPWHVCMLFWYYAHGLYAIVLSVCVFVLFAFVLLGVLFMYVLCW